MDYDSSSTKDFEFEVTESSGAKTEDDCKTTLSNECETIDINIRSIAVAAYTVKKKLFRYLGVVQNIKSEYISVQFLKMQWGENIFCKSEEFI